MRLLRRAATVMVVTVLACFFSSGLAPLEAVALELSDKTMVSVSDTGEPSNDDTPWVSLSPDGRYVGFSSSATNLSDNPGNYTQTYLRDTHENTNTLVSKTPEGEASSGNSKVLAVSRDGQLVLFSSEASDLVPDIAPDTDHLYLYDAATATNTPIDPPSVSYHTLNGGTMSQDGSLIAYTAIDNGMSYGYLYDTNSGVTTQVEVPANLNTFQISVDGTNVVYATENVESEITTTTFYRYDIQSGAHTALQTDIPIYDYRLSPGNRLVVYYSQEAGTDYSLKVMDLADGSNTVILPHLSNLGLTWAAFSSDHRYMTFLEHTEDNTRSNFGRLGVIDLTTQEKITLENNAERHAIAQFSDDGQRLAYIFLDSNTEVGRQAYVATFAEPLAAPQNLTAPTPTHTPQLSWAASPGAGSYIVYRDGEPVVTTAATNYVDHSASEGDHTYTVVAAKENTTSLPSAPITIVVDKTTPTINDMTLTPRVLLFSSTASVAAATADNLSGVAYGEYFVDNDPGQGDAIRLEYANGKLSGTADLTGLSLGFHRLYIRSVDAAGNWSDPISLPFVYLNF